MTNQALLVSGKIYCNPRSGAAEDNQGNYYIGVLTITFGSHRSFVLHENIPRLPCVEYSIISP